MADDEYEVLDAGLDIFDDVEPSEKRYYRSMYPKVDIVAERRVHCTSCNMHIGTAPINEAIVRMHPVLRVTQCKKCFTFYNSGEFEKGDDGSELYCRWCGQGGEVYCCSDCAYVFCRNCISQNLSKSCVNDISNNDNWKCFSCSPKIMMHLRAQHWALVNFMEKQKKEISRRTLNEEELNELMNKDMSTCCKKSRKSITVATAVATKRKSGQISDSALPPAKKIAPVASSPKLLNPSLPPAKSPATAVNDDQVVCTPDILSMFQEEGASPPRPPAPVTPVIPMQVQMPALAPTATPPLRPIQRQITVRKPTTAVKIAAPSTANPVYHTINGFRIDLNSAAQQETFRLPNGKLIQVKKQTPTGQVTVTTPPVQARQLTPILPMHQTRPGRQTVSVRQVAMTAIPMNHMRALHNVTAPQTLQQLLPPQQVQQPQPQPQSQAPVFIRSTHPNTPFGNAHTQFETRVESSMEVCQHIIGKINTLVNSSSYKNAKNYRDLKDLNIHLSYLLTYAIGRFKTLQEKCSEDMKKMGFAENGQAVAAAAHDKPKEDGGVASDDDDIEIVENETTLIDLDSDNEEEEKKKVDAKKKVEDELKAAAAAVAVEKEIESTTVEMIEVPETEEGADEAVKVDGAEKKVGEDVVESESKEPKEKEQEKEKIDDKVEEKLDAEAPKDDVEKAPTETETVEKDKTAKDNVKEVEEVEKVKDKEVEKPEAEIKKMETEEQDGEKEETEQIKKPEKVEETPVEKPIEEEEKIKSDDKMETDEVQKSKIEESVEPVTEKDETPATEETSTVEKAKTDECLDVDPPANDQKDEENVEPELDGNKSLEKEDELSAVEEANTEEVDKLDESVELVDTEDVDPLLNNSVDMEKENGEDDDVEKMDVDDESSQNGDGDPLAGEDEDDEEKAQEDEEKGEEDEEKGEEDEEKGEEDEEKGEDADSSDSSAIADKQNGDSKSDDDPLDDGASRNKDLEDAFSDAEEIFEKLSETLATDENGDSTADETTNGNDHKDNIDNMVRKVVNLQMKIDPSAQNNEESIKRAINDEIRESRETSNGTTGSSSALSDNDVEAIIQRVLDLQK